MKITAKENTPLLNLVMQTFPEVSVSKAKKMIIYGCISYRGAVIKSPELIIRKGDEIEYSKYSGGRHIAREKTDVPILFEDEFIIAVIKAAGIHVDARPNEKTKSLYALTKSYVRRKWGERQNLFIVHYPETDEAGVCIFAKNKKAQDILKRTLNQFKFEYHAIVAGVPKHKKDKINLWLKAGSNNRIFLEKPETDGAVLTSTQYVTLETFETYSYLLVNPLTYFPLQIRFHLSNIGNPVVGDHRFGLRQESDNWLKLYCTSIQLQHPASGKQFKIETSLPNTFSKVNLPIFLDPSQYKDNSSKILERKEAQPEIIEEEVLEQDKAEQDKAE